MKLLHLLYRLAYLAKRVQWWLLRPVGVSVCAMVVRDERVMLVWHTYRPLWFLPGGGLKRGESFDEAVRRELAEEVGVAPVHLELLGLYMATDESSSNHVAVFVTEDFTWTPRQDVEIARCEFFPLDALPPQASGGIARRVADYLRFRQDRRTLFGHW